MVKKRRPKGEGSIYQEGDHWVGEIKLNGVRRRVRGKSRVEVSKKLRALTPSSGVKLSDWIDRCVEASNRDVKPRSMEVIRRDSVELRVELGSRHVDKISVSDVDRAYTRILSRCGTYKACRAAKTLCKLLKRAMEFGIVVRNVAKLVKIPRHSTKLPQVLTADQVKTLLAVKHRRMPLIALAVLTGMRLGEILALQWSDILPDGIHISTTLYKGKRTETKTASSRRVVPMPRLDLARTSRWVFPSKKGATLCPRTLHKTFKGILRRAGLPSIRFHDLRHTCASLLLSAGHSVRAVASLLGHSDPAITLRTYAHVMPNDTARLVTSLQEMV